MWESQSGLPPICSSSSAAIIAAAVGDCQSSRVNGSWIADEDAQLTHLVQLHDPTRQSSARESLAAPAIPVRYAVAISSVPTSYTIPSPRKKTLRSLQPTPPTTSGQPSPPISPSALISDNSIKNHWNLTLRPHRHDVDRDTAASTTGSAAAYSGSISSHASESNSAKNWQSIGKDRPALEPEVVMQPPLMEADLHHCRSACQVGGCCEERGSTGATELAAKVLTVVLTRSHFDSDLFMWMEEDQFRPPLSGATAAG